MLSPTQRVVVACLRPGHIVPSETIVDALYGSRADGGPDDARHAVRAHIYKMRAKLASIGVEIETIGHGRGSDGYRLRNPELLDAIA